MADGSADGAAEGSICASRGEGWSHRCYRICQCSEVHLDTTAG